MRICKNFRFLVNGFHPKRRLKKKRNAINITLCIFIIFIISSLSVLISVFPLDRYLVTHFLLKSRTSHQVRRDIIGTSPYYNSFENSATLGRYSVTSPHTTLLAYHPFI